MWEGRSPDAQRADAGEESHGNHVLHGHVGDAHTATLLDTLQEVLHKSVHPLAETLEHDKSQRDSQDGIKHAKGLPCVGSWRCMPVSWEKSRQTEEISDAEHFWMLVEQRQRHKRYSDHKKKKKKAPVQLLFTNMTKQEISIRMQTLPKKGGIE